MGYPNERKEAVLKKMLPPQNMTIIGVEHIIGVHNRKHNRGQSKIKQFDPSLFRGAPVVAMCHR